jgi:uncharacterized delta-60 repeat protein
MKNTVLITGIAALSLVACSSNPAPTVENAVDDSPEATVTGTCLNCLVPKPGSLDTSFGRTLLSLPGTGKIVTGKRITLFGPMGMAVQPDGKFVIDSDDFNTGGLLSRFTPAGFLESTFRNGGDDIFGGYSNSTGPVAIQPDGKILVGTATWIETVIDGESKFVSVFGAYRFDPTGAIDLSFTNSPFSFPRFIYAGGGALSKPANNNYGYTTPAMALQADGKIVLATRSKDDNRMIVTRHNPSGTTDTTFGTNGYVYTSTYPGHISTPTSMGIQSDGKIVVAGNDTPSDQSTSDFTIVRYNTNGTLDTSFDGDGIARVNFVGNSNDHANAMKIQADGKIVLAGYSDLANYSNKFALARLNTNGSLDTSFGNNGLVSTNFSVLRDDVGKDMVIQANGKIVVVGKTSILTNSYRTSKFGLARYNTNGSLDTTFGTGGLVTTSFTGHTNIVANNVALQNGRILVAGYGYGGTTVTLLLARYNP